jgi:hypothetical protein
MIKTKQSGFIQGALLVIVIYAFGASTTSSGMTVAPHELPALAETIEAQGNTLKNALINLQAIVATAEWDGATYSLVNERDWSCLSDDAKLKIGVLFTHAVRCDSKKATTGENL